MNPKFALVVISIIAMIAAFIAFAVSKKTPNVIVIEDNAINKGNGGENGKSLGNEKDKSLDNEKGKSLDNEKTIGDRKPSANKVLGKNMERDPVFSMYDINGNINGPPMYKFSEPTKLAHNKQIKDADNII